jgi:SAM-dependent methyltransferase/mannose-6-phosphate isomerase-like protein (cupin superfamily)
MDASPSVQTDLRARLNAAFGALRHPSPDQLAEAWRRAEIALEDVLPCLAEPGAHPYGRVKIFATPDVEVLVMNWAARRECAPHDQGDSFGWVHVLSGSVSYTLYTVEQGDVPVVFGRRVERAGARIFVPRGLVHSIGNPSDQPTVTVHVCSPPMTGMKVYDLERRAACVVGGDGGAWWPDDQRQIAQVLELRAGAPSSAGGLLGLSELASDLVSNDAVRSALATRGLDLGSLEALDGPIATRHRVLTPAALHAGDGGRVLRVPPGGAALLVVSGRVEWIPLEPAAEPVLLGEGQTRELAAGQVFGLRTSQSSERVSLIEVSFGAAASAEVADRRGALSDIAPLRDYYYGYSDRYAAVYSAGGVTWEPEVPNEALIHALDRLGVEGGKVIDCGCGEGRDSIYLASRGFAVTGVDVARPALDRARTRAVAAGVRPTFLERDVTELRGLPEASFDLAINMGCLHMIPDPDLRARHLVRVRELLRPGGLFLLAHCRERWGEGFFSIPDYEAVAPLVPGRVLERRIRLPDGTTTMLPLQLVPYKESSEDELRAELAAAGFETMADLSDQTEAFGNTVILAARRPG